jgi:hypothetical protein
MTMTQKIFRQVIMYAGLSRVQAPEGSMPYNKAAHTACGWTRISYAYARLWRQR